MKRSIYTEIIFGAGLKKDTPKEIIKTLKMLSKGFKPDDIDHEFFTGRSWLMVAPGSYFFPGIVPPIFYFDNISKTWYLHFRTNVQNHDQIIEKFLDWIKPYIGEGSGSDNFYAIVTTDGERTPIIYYKEE